MNRLLLTAATLALLLGTGIAPAIAVAPPGPCTSSLNKWPGMTDSTSSRYVTNYALHQAVSTQDNYDPYTGRNAPDPRAPHNASPGQFIPLPR